MVQTGDSVHHGGVGLGWWKRGLGELTDWVYGFVMAVWYGSRGIGSAGSRWRVIM